MNILIADDHAIVRRGLRELLAEEYPGAYFGEAGTCADALALVAAQSWDVVVSDVTMPGRGGFDLLKEIKAQSPVTPVLLMSMHPEEEFAVRALRAGAAGYISKSSADQQLVEAVKKVLAGGKYVSPAVAERLATVVGNAASMPAHETLSNREFEVLRLLAVGKTVTEIGAELSLSVQTISTYRIRLLEKLNLQTNADLVQYARVHGLV
jgi:DNA-binding NarL/FixJ family response regulator